MMAVRNIKRVHRRECLDECRHEPPLDPPDRMPHAIEGLEFDKRRLSQPDAASKVVDLRIRTMRQKHGTGLRTQLDDVPRAIIFLVLPRPFMLFDDAAV